MRSLILFVAAISLIGVCASNDIPHVAPQDPPALALPDVCSDFGKNFCGSAKCEVVPGKTDAFVCRCERNDTYYDAAERTCLFKRTCKTTECTIGTCIESGPNKARCGCPKIDSLLVNCQIRDWFVQDCKTKGGTAVLRESWSFGAKCDCGEWAVMDRNKSKCVPTTCLRPDLTCKDLCEKKLLEKDNRCCQGWNSTDCSAVPQDDTYCSPGSIMGKSGTCEDACTAKEAKFVCVNGCRKTMNSTRAYECTCDNNYVVAEDGITCKAVQTTRACNEEQKKTCLVPNQICRVVKNRPICICPLTHQRANGQCTSRCTENTCHEDFTDCGVYMGKQSCFCPWTSRKPPGAVYIKECILREYYYTVSFTPNISLDANNCKLYEGRVLEAMKTNIGTEVFMVEILNCTEKIKARLISAKPLSKYLLKRLQTCEHPDGDLCMLYPKLPIKKDTATEIEEENLCNSLLKVQEEAYDGVNECVKDKDKDLFWFKCVAGYEAVGYVTVGRVRRSICEPRLSCTRKKMLECSKKGQICVYEDEKSKCRCPLGTVAGQDGCSEVPDSCNEEENNKCTSSGQRCVMENQKAVCKEASNTPATKEVDPEVPDACSEEESNKCTSSGQRCVMENQKAVCKEASNTPATKEVDPASSQCSEEVRKKCTKKGAECVTVDGKAVCKCPEGKVETSQGCSDPGPSSAVTVSSTTLLLLAAMTAAAAA
ncbi:glycoprotein antigen BM86-like [Dermacentor silvarum]|uniref:glycoprotein antigen BM86-like n=1 Tax=Dermacentor silvarum TaxID=543639 RepID=UPI00189ACD13|nr:glycoprotein antigen BM86-like [Dermacentor silvarum]